MPGYAYILSQEAGRYRYLTNTTTDLLGSGVMIVAEDWATAVCMKYNIITLIHILVLRPLLVFLFDRPRTLLDSERIKNEEDA